MKPRNSRVSQSQSILNSGTTVLRRHRPDYGLIIIGALLLVVGLITLYAISPGLAVTTNTSESYYVVKQLIAIAVGLAGFFIATKIHIETWQKYLAPLVVISFIAALAVRLVGQRINGAYRWIQISGFSFQAAELIKFTLLIWLASFFAIRIKNGQLRDFKSTIRPLLIVLVVIGLIVAGLESDLGSAGVMVVMMGLVAFIAGVPFKKVAIIVAVVAVVLVIAISSSSYREQRLFTFLHPTQNCQTAGSGYQACQSLIAVGSGGLFGKGLARSVQDYGYLPEADNDSIFAVYAEQFGFVGVAILVCLFMALFIRLIDIMKKAPNNYSRFIVAGVLGWLATQTLINIGAMMGLLPLKGITLPLISYGGTSIVFVMVIIGLVFNISHYTTTRLTNEDDISVKGNNYEDNIMRGRNRRAHYANSLNRT